MSSPEELERIRNVYAYYDQSSTEQRKRDRTNPGNRARTAELRRTLASMLRAAQNGAGFGTARVLDVGCGNGETLRWLADLGFTQSNLTGVDLLPDRVSAARHASPGMRFECLNAEELPFPDASFDLVVCFTLFSSILDASMRSNVAAEVRRVLTAHGSVLWYDFRYRNPANPNTTPMARRDLASLFPGFDLRVRSISVLPPLARRLGAATSLGYPLLATVPVLRSHYAGLLVRHA